jgi:hypothetical protein
MSRCAVCGEPITETNMYMAVPQTLNDDLFFCNGPECAKTGETFTQINGIQQRTDQIWSERARRILTPQK